jgi:hypothetical protein
MNNGRTMRRAKRGTQGFAFHQLGHQKIGANVVKCANVGMVQRRDGAKLAVESIAETLGPDLDGHPTQMPTALREPAAFTGAKAYDYSFFASAAAGAISLPFAST